MGEDAVSVSCETEVRIGGHDGMDVLRTESGILKRAKTAHSWKALKNEYGILRHLSGTGLAPEPITINEMDYETLQEDLGDSMVPGGDAAPHPDFDPETIRHSMINWLYRLRFPYNTRHGDSTGINVIIRNNKWIGIDWQESHALTEKAPQKQPWTDGYMCARTLRDLELDANRIGRRWMAMLESLSAARHRKTRPLYLRGQTFVDYGCYEGDFVALAAAEGMHATGYDTGGFQQGYDSIEGAKRLWADIPSASFVKADIFDVEPHAAYVGICFSTWPYLVQQRGRDAAAKWLGDAIAATEFFFFEAQYEGDGWGVDTEESIRQMLIELAPNKKVSKLTTISVAGRPAERTVWEVRPEWPSRI